MVGRKFEIRRNFTVQSKFHGAGLTIAAEGDHSTWLIFFIVGGDHSTWVYRGGDHSTWLSV